MKENDGTKTHDNYKEIVIELLNKSLNRNLSYLEKENEEELINLENFKQFFNEYSSTIDIMFREISEIEKKNNEKEEKDEKENKKEKEKEEKKENKKEKEKEEKKENKKEKEKENKKEKEKENKKEKEKEEKKENKKDKEKKHNKKESEKKLNNKKENYKKHEEKKENKENKSMTRSQTLGNLKEGKKEETTYLKTEPSNHKKIEKKPKTMLLHSQTERALKPIQKNKGDSSSKGKKTNTNKTSKKNIKKNAAYYLKTFCKENWFENILSYLPISDRNILIESSKIFKQYQLQKMNNLKTLLLNLCNIKEGNTIEDKINYFKNKYSEEELNKPYLNFEMSKGTVKAIQLLNNEEYIKIFNLNNLDDELNEIYIIYRCLCYLINQKEIAEIKSDKLFWSKFCEFINENSKGKIGDFINELSKNLNFDDKNGLLLEKLVCDIKNKIVPSYYCKICTTTGLFSFLIKDALEYNGVLSLNKKTQVSRLYHNLEYTKTIIDQVNKYINYLTKL